MILAEFGWKVAEYAGEDLRVHGLLFVLFIVALVAKVIGD